MLRQCIVGVGLGVLFALVSWIAWILLAGTDEARVLARSHPASVGGSNDAPIVIESKSPSIENSSEIERIPTGENPSVQGYVSFEPATLEGHVYDLLAGTPIAGARVGLAGTSGGAFRATITDGAGAFRLTPLLPGRSFYAHVHVQGLIETLVRLDPLDSGTQNKDIQVDRRGKIHVRVADSESRTGIPHFAIRLEWASGRTKIETDESGTASISGGVSIGSGDMRLRTEECSGFGSCRWLAPLEIAGDPEVLLVIGASGFITGRVVDVAGQPIRGVGLSFDVSRDFSVPPCVDDLAESLIIVAPRIAKAKTDDDGRFELWGVLHGMKGRLVLELPDRSPVTVDIPRILKCGERRVVDIVVPEGAATIDGRLSFEGRPTAGVVSWRTDRIGVTTRSREDGSFRLEGIPAGTGLLVAELFPGSASANVKMSIDPQRSRTQDLNIRCDGIIRGTVFDGQGQRVSNARVLATSIERIQQGSVRELGSMDLDSLSSRLPDFDTVTDFRGEFAMRVEDVRQVYSIVVTSPTGESCRCDAVPGTTKFMMVRQRSNRAFTSSSAR